MGSGDSDDLEAHKLKVPKTRSTDALSVLRSVNFTRAVTAPEHGDAPRSLVSVTLDIDFDYHTAHQRARRWCVSRPVTARAWIARVFVTAPHRRRQRRRRLRRRCRAHGRGEDHHRRRHDNLGKCADSCAVKPATAMRAASIVTAAHLARTARTKVGGETIAR